MNKDKKDENTSPLGHIELNGAAKSILTRLGSIYSLVLMRTMSAFSTVSMIFGVISIAGGALLMTSGAGDVFGYWSLMWSFMGVGVAMILLGLFLRKFQKRALRWIRENMPL